VSTIALPALRRESAMAIVAAGGVLLGVAYTLSPLSVLTLAALTWASIAASRGLSEREHRWYWSIIVTSVVIRLIAIALLFYTADPAKPFASFFGDEELYKFRTIWLRNIGAGLPMSPADVIYSYDDVGHTSYVFVLAYVQALVGDAPYGLHVMNMGLFMCGLLGLYRLARASYGAVVAMAGLIVLLCLPSLALWSISVLKEPMSLLMIAVEIACVVAIARAPRWWQKAAALVVTIASARAMETLRTGGELAFVAGAVGGLLLAFVLRRGRRLAVAMIAAPVIIAIAASLPAVQDRVLSNLRYAAMYHAGHVLTPGYSYRLVSDGYYVRRELLRDNMPPADVSRFVVKAVASYFAQPVPWEMKSRTMLAYLPEQVVWYFIALLLPFGIYAGLKRDIVLTSVLAAHAAAAIVIVALSSGNIGTLIRHRSLVMPYVVWLSAAGAHDLARRVAAGRASSGQRSSDGDR
jgi:hypothetical protein